MNKNGRYVFFATAWSAVEGGVNSFNFDLCKSICAEGVKPYVVLPSTAQIPEDEGHGVEFLRLQVEFDKFGTSSISEIKHKVPNDGVGYWVGHDAITGGMALMAASALGGRSVVVHHMDYSNYYYLKSSDGHKKIQAQRALIKNADVVLCVGPRLLNDARHLRPVHSETYEIIPGVPDYSRESWRKTVDHRISFCGRLSDAEDKVKNISAGIKAAAKYLSEITSRNGSLALIGVEKSDLSRLSELKDRSVAINLVPYVVDRNEYFAELCCSDLLVMPSVREGFGLVAWEALSLGIPVIISKSSGLYEYLDGLGLTPLVCSIDISGIPAIDEGVIAAGIRNCFADYVVHRSNTLKVSESLRKNTWQVTARRFLDLLSSEQLPVVNDVSLKVESPIEVRKQAKQKSSAVDKENQLGGAFDRFEDVLALTVRKRELVFDRVESTDYSRSQKIKFEFWSAQNPMQAYYLYLPPFVNLKQTIGRLCAMMASSNKPMPRQIFVLRRDKGDAAYLIKLFLENKLNVQIDEYSLKEYIWEYCIDDEFKLRGGVSAPLNYVDQEITSEGVVEIGVSARELLVGKLSGKPECSAYLVIAPGGMGKTWLCRSVAVEVAEKNKSSQLVVLIQAEGLKDYVREVGTAHIQVNTIFDLYELYARAQGVSRKYDRGTFELSILTGNIVLVVDGLDELVTVLQERFDLSKFLASVVDMSAGLMSSHVLLTTRDGLLVDTKTSEAYGIKRYELLGFTDRDWMKYANKRFHGSSQKSQIVEKLRTTLSSSKLTVDGVRVVPFFVDVLCNIFEDDVREKGVISFSLKEDPTPYPSNNEIIDRVVYSVFRREIRRQNIDLDVAQLVGLLSELVSEHGEDFGAAALRTNLELYYETRANDLIQKIKLNPLLQVESGLIRLRYDFLQSYFRSLFLIDCLQRRLTTSEALGAYAKCNSSESQEIGYLTKFYSGSIADLESQLSDLIPKLRDKARMDSDGDAKRLELSRRAMSGVWKIYRAVRQFSGARLTDKMLEVLSGSVPGKSIDGLAIYGEFSALDFTNTTVMNSKFLDYSDFARCKFSGARFISCVFERCGGLIVSGGSLHLAEFESGCTLGDVADMVALSELSSSNEERLIESECLAFLRSFFKAGGEYDPKKAWIKFSTKIRGLRLKDFVKMTPEFIVVKTKKSDETYYSIAPDFVESARRFVDNNYVDGRMRDFINFVK